MLKTRVLLLQVVGLHGAASTSYSSGEFVVGQVFHSKFDLQEAAKIYSIKAHQEFVVVASSKKLLVLRCKKAEEYHYPWKLRAMVVKDTCLFIINKYIGSHTCVNPCLNRDHHQLDSNLVVAHIKTIIMAQFTLSTTAIQTSVMEKWGYEISYKRCWMENIKQLDSYLVISLNHIKSCHVCSLP